jgi:uncharacterized protein YdeI (YjbR/CyaY-like superfamily)
MALAPETHNCIHLPHRAAWREWLASNHSQCNEIWLIYPNKNSGKDRVPYNEAVEEALCFGWIDGLAKTWDTGSSAQRYTPRKARSNWSELNKERCRRLIAQGLMQPAGLAALSDALERPFIYPVDILAALKTQPLAWQFFNQQPEYYRRIRVGYIDEVRKNAPEFQKRLDNFIKRTHQQQTFGTLKP